MDSKCIFALFADEMGVSSSGFNLINVHMDVNYLGVTNPLYLDRIDLTLFVGIWADEGRHRLTISHTTAGFIDTINFELLPEHENTWVQESHGQFPVVIGEQVNEYPLLLDGEPLGTAYLRVKNPQTED